MEHGSSDYTWMYKCVYKGKSKLELILEIPSPSNQQYINFRAELLFNKLKKRFSYSW